MSSLCTLGRILFAIALVALGLEQLLTGTFSVGLFPFPPVFPGRFMLVLVFGLALIVAGLSIGLLREASISAFGLGILFLGLTLGLHAPALLANLHNGNTWTVFAELLAFSGGAFYASAVLPPSARVTAKLRYDGLGKSLFVVALLIFGVLHFVYAAYIATLIPTWIPARLFWAYFVGVAFCGTAISLVLNRQQPLSTGLLGLMFLLWVLLLHAPRVAKNPQIEPEWTSLFVALSMGGLAFMIAGTSDQTDRKQVHEQVITLGDMFFKRTLRK